MLALVYQRGVEVVSRHEKERSHEEANAVHKQAVAVRRAAG
jgi:hypothetical protein